MPANVPTYASLFADHARRLSQTHLRTLIADPARGGRLRHRAGPLLLDLSRQKLDVPALDALGAQLEASGWQAARDAMFAGAPINSSEQRAVLHTALRAGGSALSSPAPAEARREIEATLERIERGDVQLLPAEVEQQRAGTMAQPFTARGVGDQRAQVRLCQAAGMVGEQRGVRRNVGWHGQTRWLG